MNRWWSVLFGVVMLACFGLFVAAPFCGWWLPKNVSSFGPRVDTLFYLILWITGFFFIVTEALLVYFMYVYAGGPGTREQPVGHHYAEEKGALWTVMFKRLFRPVSALLHDQHRVELAWTLVPAVILLYIAFAQISTWQDIKDPANMPEPEMVMEVSARMFEWRVRYPATPLPDAGSDQTNKEGRTKRAWQWANNPEMDDVHVVNEIHVWQNAPVRVFLKTRDVIHSFYLPNLRLKQDALPGKTIPVWFKVTREGEDNIYNAAYNEKTKRWDDGYNPETKKFDDTTQVWELACAELCGWGHYKMQGRLYVHKDKADYLKWLASAKERMFSTQSKE